MIELIPAIDIINGQCVRLTKGDYAQKSVYSDSPADVAAEFERFGMRRLHVVDLDGAKSQHIVNTAVLRSIAERTNLVIDFGGGIKSDEDIELAFDNGAAMVTIGSIAVKEPETFCRWLKRYGADRIILGADVRNGMISINGWREDSTLPLLAFLKEYIQQGVHHVLCTEISRDGMLNGPATNLYTEILAAYPGLNLIASGGVSSADDILDLERHGIPSVVFGKAYYEGRIDLEKLCKCSNS